MGSLLGIILMAASGYLLLKSVAGFRRMWREAEIVRGPAVPEQTVQFPVAGDISLFLDGPRYKTYWRRLQYALFDARSGAPVPITPVFTGSGVRSLRRSRVQRGRFALPAPGPYVLRVGGLSPGEAAEYAIVFMHPITARLLRFILTCVFLGMVFIGSLVLAILSAVL
jgi:hypothetical protein